MECAATSRRGAHCVRCSEIECGQVIACKNWGTGTGMNRRHRELLGKTPTDDADVRGEHTYPNRTSQTSDAPPDALERSHYAAGADGTQVVSESEGAALPEEDEP